MNFLKEIHRRSPVLSITAWIHFALMIIFLLLMAIDHRELLGVNVWNKPFKFAASIFLYLLTFAYLVGYVKHLRIKSLIAVGTSITMIMEIVLISIQAARGVRSHFNIDSIFDSVIFSLMGVSIAFATVFACVLAGYFTFFPPKELPNYMNRAIQFGLWISILGSSIGGYMSAQLQHTVGAPDGGPGLPLLNWSMEYGDMRIPHFVGLHALQIIPLLALGIGNRLKKPKVRMGLTWLIIVCYLFFLIIAFSIAYTGNPFLRL
ncbi:hypothetical protein [Oceanobacillus rekensis]|uniref:hypothetical protein n=1 Tax=Oceanobacillus rekensis TaxID=937927 RepID=UPI000B44D550|nr:hypothetical protein [Oceanobacillus rekensis]